MDIKETISKVPPIAWIAGGGLVLGLILLMNRGSGGTSTSSTGGLAPDAQSILGGLNDAANALGQGGSGSIIGGGSGGSTTTPPSGGSTTPPPSGGSTTPPPSGGTTSVKTLTGYTARITSKTGIPYYSSSAGGKIIGHLYSASVSTTTPVKVAGLWWYKITSSSNKALVGKWFKATSTGVTWTKNYTTVQVPTTTSTTSTVQSSNNAVA